MKYLKRKMLIQIITWAVGVIFLSVAITTTLIYLIPDSPTLHKFATTVFLILLYFIAWTVRGFYSDSKDTLIADMGNIELQVLKAQIEQVLKNRE